MSDLYKDFQKLELHLQMLPGAVKCTPLDGMYVREVTRVHTICDNYIQSAIKYKSITLRSVQAYFNMLDDTGHHSNS